MNHQYSVDDSIVESFHRFVEESGGAGPGSGTCKVAILLTLAEPGLGTGSEVGADQRSGRGGSGARCGER